MVETIYPIGTVGEEMMIKNEIDEGLKAFISNEEMKKKDIKMNLTVSRATYLENALRCACPPDRAPLDLTRKLREVEEAWKDAASLCEEYLKELK